MNVVGTRKFRDHHAYTKSDVRSLLSARKKSGAACFVTTEKDAINLEPFLDQLAPLHVAPVYMQIEDANAVARTLWAAIAARNHRPA